MRNKILVSMLMMMLLPSMVHALGTTANTQILNQPGAVTLNFQNGLGGSVTRNSSTSTTTNVGAVYGLSGTFSGGQIAQTTGAGVEVGFTAHAINNRSNTSVTINANNGLFSLSATAGDLHDWQSRFSGTVLNSLEGWVTNNANLPFNTWGASVVRYGRYVYNIAGAPGASATATSSVYVSQINANGSLTSWALSAQSLPSKLYSPSAVVYQNRIYVMGGKNESNTIQSSVYATTINANGTLTGWVSVSSLPESLSLTAAIVHDNFIYIAGGEGGDYSDKVYRGQILANGNISWNPTPTLMSNQRYYLTVAIHNRHFYVIGGRDAVGTYLNSIQMATINADGSLATFANANNSGMPPISNHSAEVYNGQLYLIGGGQGGTPYNQIYRSSISNNGVLSAWTQVSTLSQRRHFHQSFIFDGRIYTVGGATGGNPNTSATSINYYTNLVSVQGANVSSDQNQGFNFFTTPSLVALNGSQGQVSANYFLGWMIPTSQIGNYTGFNGSAYGGSERVSALTTTTVTAPDIVYVSRAKTIQAPAQYISNGGSATAPVPGALIHYQIVIKNQGSAGAATVNIYEKIRQNPLVGPTDGAVNLFYGSALTPNITTSFPATTIVNYSNNGGTSYGHILNPGKIDTGARDIRWTIPSMPAGGTATINYSVVINDT